MKPSVPDHKLIGSVPQRPELGLRVFPVVCEMHRNAVPSFLHRGVFFHFLLETCSALDLSVPIFDGDYVIREIFLNLRKIPATK